MRLSPLAAVAAACVLTLTACGGDDDPESKSPDKSGSPSATLGEVPTNKNGKPKKEKPVPLGDVTVCKALDAGEMGEVIGATLKRGKVQNNTCVFADPNDPSNTYVGVTQITLEAAGGEEAVVAGLASLVSGEPEEVDLGDQAYVVVGPTPAGENAAAGVVQVGDAVVSIGFPVPVDGNPEDAKAQVTELLELVAEVL